MLLVVEVVETTNPFLQEVLQGVLISMACGPLQEGLDQFR